jgi:hypothetical protein
MNTFELIAKIKEWIEAYTKLNNMGVTEGEDGSYELSVFDDTHEALITISAPNQLPGAEDPTLMEGDPILMIWPDHDMEYQIVHIWNDNIVIQYDGAGNADPGNMCVLEPDGELHEGYWFNGERFHFNGWVAQKNGQKRRLLSLIVEDQ